jgi:hypothetical protein
MSGDCEDAWVGWLHWRGRWCRACSGSTIAQTATRLAQRAALLKLPSKNTVVLAAGEAAPTHKPGHGWLPEQWGKHAGPAPTNRTGKAGKREG